MWYQQITDSRTLTIPNGLLRRPRPRLHETRRRRRRRTFVSLSEWLYHPTHITKSRPTRHVPDREDTTAIVVVCDKAFLESWDFSRYPPVRIHGIALD